MADNVMTKTELINFIKENEPNPMMTKAMARRATESFITAIQNKIAEGGTIRIQGLGTFSTTNRPERMGRNIQTGEQIKIPAHRAVKFKAGTELRRIAAGE